MPFLFAELFDTAPVAAWLITFLAVPPRRQCPLPFCRKARVAIVFAGFASPSLAADNINNANYFSFDCVLMLTVYVFILFTYMTMFRLLLGAALNHEISRSTLLSYVKFSYSSTVW